MPSGVYARRPLDARFASKIRKTSGCWIWLGGTDKKGYGRMWVFGQDKRATHVAMFLASGDWPNLQVLHRCDTPACVNPEHLFLGTIADNMKDKCIKGRQAKGAKNGASKLSEEGAKYIKASTEPLAYLAHKFGVDKSLVWMIRTGKIWRHL